MTAHSSTGQRRWQVQMLAPLVWLAPVLTLLIGVVVYPMIEMAGTSVHQISRAGVTRDFNGLDNFTALLTHPDLPSVLVQTGLWVASVVGLTLVVSWPIALLLNADFPGRALVRYAVIVPWAASLVMTSLIVRWMANYYHGTANVFLGSLGISGTDWLGSAQTAWVVLIATGVYVSVPFTTYVILAGVQAIPEEVYEAAKLDGANWWQTWNQITRPMVRNSVLVAVVLNVIGVFNSFPIIWLITEGGPSRATSTTITFMYELAFRGRAMGQAAALSVANLVLLLIIIGVYVRRQGRANAKGGTT